MWPLDGHLPRLANCVLQTTNLTKWSIFKSASLRTVSTGDIPLLPFLFVIFGTLARLHRLVSSIIVGVKDGVAEMRISIRFASPVAVCLRLRFGFEWEIEMFDRGARNEPIEWSIIRRNIRMHLKIDGFTFDFTISEQREPIDEIVLRKLGRRQLTATMDYGIRMAMERFSNEIIDVMRNGIRFKIAVCRKWRVWACALIIVSGLSPEFTSKVENSRHECWLVDFDKKKTNAEFSFRFRWT